MEAAAELQQASDDAGELKIARIHSPCPEEWSKEYIKTAVAIQTWSIEQSVSERLFEA